MLKILTYSHWKILEERENFGDVKLLTTFTSRATPRLSCFAAVLDWNHWGAGELRGAGELQNVQEL